MAKKTALTEGMSQQEIEAFEMRQLEKDVVYADTNPILVKQLEAKLEGRDLGATDVEEHDEPQLLSIEDQVELQETVKALMNEVKQLKKKLAESGGGGGGTLGGTRQQPKVKKLKHKVAAGGEAEEEEDKV
jgi:hypothetical protein